MILYRGEAITPKQFSAALATLGLPKWKLELARGRFYTWYWKEGGSKSTLEITDEVMAGFLAPKVSRSESGRRGRVAAARGGVFKEFYK